MFGGWYPCCSNLRTPFCPSSPSCFSTSFPSMSQVRDTLRFSSAHWRRTYTRLLSRSRSLVFSCTEGRRDPHFRQWRDFRTHVGAIGGLCHNLGISLAGQVGVLAERIVGRCICPKTSYSCVVVSLENTVLHCSGRLACGRQDASQLHLLLPCRRPCTRGTLRSMVTPSGNSQQRVPTRRRPTTLQRASSSLSVLNASVGSMSCFQPNFIGTTRLFQSITECNGDIRKVLYANFALSGCPTTVHHWFDVDHVHDHSPLPVPFRWH